MRATFAPLVFAALAVANPAPQAVTSAIAPPSSPPPGCSENYDGTFLIGPVNVTKTKRDLDGPIDERNTQLGITLKGGILTDPQGRTGYVAANQQFQFDGPPQAGAIWTAGFSVCQNGSLALGGDVFWYKCLSGSFYNLYFKSIGGQCIQSYLVTRPIGGQGGPAPVSNTPSSTPVITTTAGTTTAGNSTMNLSTTISSSSSMIASNSTISSSSGVTMTTSTETTVGGGGGRTTTGPGMTGSPRPATTATTTGSPSPAAASSSSSSISPGAAVATLKADIFGLAAGVLAMAVL